MANKIGAWAEAIKQHEGYYPPSPKYPKGSRSFRNNNPGNFRCAKWLMEEFGAVACEENFLVFPDYQHGWRALIGFLTYAAQGKLKSYHPEMGLYNGKFPDEKRKEKPGFFQVYAPSADSNNPKNYAAAVAQFIGAKVEEPIRNFLEESDEAIHIPVSGDAPETGVKTKYTIQKGDTLYMIAVNFLGSGSRWPEIAKLNGLTNPKRLRIGSQIELPKK